MHLENLTCTSSYINPIVTTLPDIQCQNSPTITTFAKQTAFDIHDVTGETTLIDNRNYFDFQNQHFTPQNEHEQPILPQNYPQTYNLDDEITTDFHLELTEDQLNLERQFSTAFFNTLELDNQNYDDTTLLCDFEEPIDKTTNNLEQCSSPSLYSDHKQLYSSSPTSYSEISLSEFSPLNFMSDTENLSDKDINFDIQNELSNSSFSFDLFSSNTEEVEDRTQIGFDEMVDEHLPSICQTFMGKHFGYMLKQEKHDISNGNIITSHYSNINNFLRNSSATSIDLFVNEQNSQKNTYGHLLSAQPINNNLSEVDNNTYIYENSESENYPNFDSANYLSENQIILPQKDAILGTTDPFLSSSTHSNYKNIHHKSLDNFSAKFKKHLSEIATTEDTYNFRIDDQNEDIINENDIVSDENDEFSSNNLARQCRWAECYKQFYGETLLVKHIEKFHVEIKRGDEFACFWENCPRKTKPFNARYKLLIHMRVHSGEKPNKCSWPRCNKAFSRLENLKIHQRSHTGERPYKCQHGGCHKAFSNSSDRAKHQRTHVDTKPYACQVANCLKRYTDPSSLRKHVKNHSLKEQAYVKRRQKNVHKTIIETAQTEELVKTYPSTPSQKRHTFNEANLPTTTNTHDSDWKMTRLNIRQDLKNKIMMNNDKARKTQNKESKNDNSLLQQVNETFQNVVSSTTVKHFDNNEFIPYESVQRLFSDKIDYVMPNEIYDAIF